MKREGCGGSFPQMYGLNRLNRLSKQGGGMFFVQLQSSLYKTDMIVFIFQICMRKGEVLGDLPQKFFWLKWCKIV